MNETYILEYSKSERGAGRYPYHIRLKDGKRENDGRWFTIFTGTQYECQSEMERHADKTNFVWPRR